MIILTDDTFDSYISKQTFWDDFGLDFFIFCQLFSLLLCLFLSPSFQSGIDVIRCDNDGFICQFFCLFIVSLSRQLGFHFQDFFLTDALFFQFDFLDDPAQHFINGKAGDFLFHDTPFRVCRFRRFSFTATVIRRLCLFVDFPYPFLNPFHDFRVLVGFA